MSRKLLVLYSSLALAYLWVLFSMGEFGEKFGQNASSELPAFERAYELITSYLEIKKELSELGVIRTNRLISADFAEWIISKYLDLELCSNPGEKDIDATDTEGRTYQIKSRIVYSLNDTTSFDMKADKLRFDYLVGVFFSPELKVIGIIRVTRELIEELGSRTGEKDIRFRWNTNLQKHPEIEKLYWEER